MQSTTPSASISHRHDFWLQARQHFEREDPLFSTCISSLPDPKRAEPMPVIESLGKAIVGQQLSVPAAATIWSRLLAHHQGAVSVSSLLAATQEEHRSLGVSQQKHARLQALAEHAQRHPGSFRLLESKSDDALIKDWTRIHGVGVWTVQMHLIFQMERPDVFPVADLGIRRAMERSLGLEKDAPKGAYEKRALVWGPFRTAASRFLWDWFANQPK